MQRKKLKGDDYARLKSGQRSWIKARNAECADAAADCLRQSYLGRLRAMAYPHMRELESS